MKVDKIVNWELILHPANWLIIFLILYFVALLSRAVYQAATTGQALIPNPLT